MRSRGREGLASGGAQLPRLRRYTRSMCSLVQTYLVTHRGTCHATIACFGSVFHMLLANTFTGMYQGHMQAPSKMRLQR